MEKVGGGYEKNRDAEESGTQKKLARERRQQRPSEILPICRNYINTIVKLEFGLFNTGQNNIV